MENFPLLSVVTFLPLLGAVLLLFVDKAQTGLAKGIGLVFSLLTFGVSLPLYFAGAGADFDFVGGGHRGRRLFVLLRLRHDGRGS